MNLEYAEQNAAYIATMEEAIGCSRTGVFSRRSPCTPSWGKRSRAPRPRGGGGGSGSSISRWRYLQQRDLDGHPQYHHGQQANGGNGGGIFNRGTLTVTHSAITDNEANFQRWH